MKSFLLLGRPGCHLCEDFLNEMLQVFPSLEGRVTQTNVDDQPDWRMLYGVRIPVLLGSDGTVLAEGHFSPDKLRAALGT
ncbi:MAG: glutaredoxin family protein [Pseudomonadota bacterium]